MGRHLLFSVIDFQMYVNDDRDNKWFDVDLIEKMTFSTKFIPLFNAVSSKNHDVWDDYFFGSINMVITFFEENNGNKNEAISYVFPFEPINIDNNIYEINLELKFEDFMSNISHIKFKNKESSYSFNLSYYIEENIDESTDVFQMIVKNKIFKTYIPFNKNGDWLNGK